MEAQTARKRTRIVVKDSSPVHRRLPRAKDEKGSVETRMKDFVNTQSLSDPFDGFYGLGVGHANDVVQPPYNPYALAKLPYENSSLLQCIQAMVLNCHGHGWQLEYVGPDGGENSEEAKKEKVMLEKLLNFPNDQYSLQELAERARFDKESMGYWTIEVTRDKKRRVTGLFHVPAQTMRRTTRDREPVEVEVSLPRDGSDTSKVKKYFCRFVQIVNEKKVYFKEFGDPRKIDPTTGRENPALKPDQEATEILYSGIYYPTSPYGVPRWINQLPSIMGSRQAELTNLDYFKDNAIPAMAVLVSGGVLTQTTLENIEDQMTAIKGRAASHRMVFIEASGDEDLASENGQVPIPKVEFKSLRSEKESDALFQNYEEDCEQKIRSAFRLPPLFVGRSQEYTYATAQTSYEVAEGQVFGPERRAFDSMIDMTVLATYGAKFWRFRSQQPKITDPKAVVEAMKAFDVLGAMTPNVAIRLANEFFDLDMKPIDDEWGNWPFEIVKNLAAQGKLDGTEEIEREIEEPDPEALDPNAPGVPGETADPADTEDPEEAQKMQDPKVLVAQALKELRNVLKANNDALAAAA